MAHLLTPRFVALGCWLSAAWLLGGCCANNVCDPDDPLADAVELRFTSAFTAADLDTLVVQRYPKDTTGGARPETVTLMRTQAQGSNLLVLSNTAPFPRMGTASLGQYRYVVQYFVRPRGGKPVADTALVIDGISIRGEFTSTGCCTNYANTEKIVYARDSAFNLTGQDRPVLKVLK